MIDRAVLDELAPELRAAVESAALTIHNSGVLDRQLSVSFESIVAGATSEDPTVLANRILQYRQENHGILAFQALAETIKKDHRNA